MIEWLFKFVVIWLSVSTIIIATGWYISTTIRFIFPDWWRRVVADENSEFN